MRLRTLAAMTAVSALAVMAPVAAAKPKSDATGPNQGEKSKVLTADNPLVSCAAPVATPKVEGDMGRTISVSAAQPIDRVTLKSGKGAVVVSASFPTANSATITLSKDVSNYIVWVCPGGGGGGPLPT